MHTQSSYNLIQEELEEVRTLLRQQLYCDNEQICEILEVLSRHPGKLIRSVMLLLCSKLFGKTHLAHIKFAAMVELIHMASLLHDDVIDRAKLRRGQPSANILWGDTAAVLLGDFLLSRAFILSADSGYEAASVLLAKTAQDICVGELHQNLSKGRIDLNENEYLEIIEAKTATLFRCSCQLGAMVSNAPSDQQVAIRQIGNHLGIAFQIADDIRDMLSTEQDAGKTLGTDLLQAKLTLPVIYWIRQDPQDKDCRIQQIKECKSPGQLIKKIRNSGSIEMALQFANSHLLAAKQSLETLPRNDAQKALLEFADSILAETL